MAIRDQNYKVFLSFKDEATGKFIKATEDQIAAMKKLGINVKKEGASVAIDMDKIEEGAKKGGRGFRFLGGEITGVMKSLGSMRNMLLVYFFALRPIINLIKESIAAYTEQEDAMVRLTVAMGLQGTSAKVVGDNLLTLSKRFQETTRYSDETALKIMDTLVTIGNVMPSELGKVTTAVMDFATKTRRDPVDAALLFAKGALGITTGLRRAGIAIDEATPKSRVLAEMLRFVNKQMGGAAQADIETYAGKMKQLANSTDEIKESLGKLLIESLGLNDVMLFWKGVLDKTNKSISGEVSVIDLLEKKLNAVNKQIAVTGKQNPFMKFLGLEAINQADMQKLIVEKSNLTNSIVAENKAKTQKELATRELLIQKDLEQQKLSAQEKFDTALRSSSRTRVDTEKKALEEDYALYSKFVTDKIMLDMWYLDERTRIHKEELRLVPRMEDAKESIDSLNEYLGKEGTAYVDFMKTFAKGAEEALTTGFIDIVKGNFKGLEDVVANFGEQLLQMMMQMAARALLIKIGFAAFMGVHTGGYIQHGRESSAGYSRKKYHGGGEVNATLLEGEGVVNQKGMANLGVDNLNKLNRGEKVGSGGTVNNYYIQTIDERSFRERLQQHGDIYANASEQGIADNAPIRGTMQRWG